MEIKNVTLKNIKRSYRRVEDLCMGSDMGWWFCDRRDAIDALGEIQTIGEVLEVGRGSWNTCRNSTTRPTASAAPSHG